MRRPLTGAILGFLLGLAIAVIFQQQGLYPLDQVAVFLIPGILGVIGMLLLSVGREGSTVTYVIAIVLLVPALVWGALGIGDTNQQGQLNGGCLVSATSSVPDQTQVTDSFKQDPFRIDPQGSLHWEAASPTIFMDYDWEMWVELGGIAVPFDSGHELNDGGSPANMGDVGNVTEYAESVGVPIDQLRGVFMVGGFAATCDGFGFVMLTSDGLTTVSIIALIVAVLILITLIILMFVGRGGSAATATAAGAAAAGAEDEEPGPAAEIAAGALESGYAKPEAYGLPPEELSDEDVDEILDAADDDDRGPDL